MTKLHFLEAVVLFLSHLGWSYSPKMWYIIANLLTNHKFALSSLLSFTALPLRAKDRKDCRNLVTRELVLVWARACAYNSVTCAYRPSRTHCACKAVLNSSASSGEAFTAGRKTGIRLRKGEGLLPVNVRITRNQMWWYINSPIVPLSQWTKCRGLFL